MLSVFSEVSITAIYFDNQKKTLKKQKIKQNNENLEHRFNFHMNLFLLNIVFPKQCKYP